MKQIVLIIITVLICFGYNSSKEDIQPDMEVLIKVIYSALKLDSNLNTPNYWIDFSKVQYFSEKTIKEFLHQNKNFERISADSLFQNDSTWLKYEYLDKMLITFKSINQKDDLLIITIDKIVSADGANGVEIIFKKSKGKYTLISTKITWIS